MISWNRDDQNMQHVDRETMFQLLLAKMVIYFMMVVSVLTLGN